jgi:hypothetical protein
LEEVKCGGDVVTSFVPVIRKLKQRPVREPHSSKSKRKYGPCWNAVDQPGEARWGCTGSAHGELVDRAGRNGNGGALRFKCDGAEGLFVLGEILAKHVPKGLGLLRAEVDAAVILHGYLVGGFGMGDAEVEEEVPYADSDLHAVSVGFAIIGGLDEVDPGLLCGVHG